MLEGKSMPSNMAANTNHTTLLKNQSAIKYLLYMRFLSNFACKILFMCYINFWHQQDSNSLFKGSIGVFPFTIAELFARWIVYNSHLFA